MKKSRLDTPHIKEQIVKQLAAGESQNSIAHQRGLNQSSVCRFANREDIRKLIEQKQAKLLEVVPDAVQNIKDLVSEMKDIPENDLKRRELSYKASKDVLKTVGLLPTPIQSQTFINLTQQNTQLISPFALELISKHMDDTTLPEGMTLDDEGIPILADDEA